MANRRIDQLNPNLNPLTGAELIPIFDTTSNTTERISITTLGDFIDSTNDTFINAVGFSNSNDLLTLYRNDGSNLSTTIGRYNRWYVPSGQTLTIPSNFQSFIYGDFYVEGTLFLEDNSQMVVINGDIILSGGTISGSGTTYLIDLPEYNSFVTNGVYNLTTKSIDFTGNFGFTPFSVDLNSLSTDNFYTTGATLNGNVVEFNRNDLVNAYSVDLSSLVFTGNTFDNPIVNLYVSNLFGNSPITFQDSIQSTGSTASGLLSFAFGTGNLASGDYSHAGGYGSVSSGDTSFIHSTNSTVIGDRSVVLGGQNITGVTSDTVYVPSLNINTTPSNDNALTQVLVRDTDGTIKYRTSSSIGGGTNLGNILYVSKNGNDLTATKGDLNKPWGNLYAAKSASTSGDTIYVLPGTWIYDNRDSAGNPYNGKIESLVNLWKNDVTWYFSPGSKIVHYNQTVTGEYMHLFRPLGTTYETCTVKGYLEYEGYSTGVDTVNGYTNFFDAQELVGTSGYGYNFICNVKSIITSPSTIAGTRDNVISTVGKVSITADYVAQNYIGGQTGAGTALSFRGSGLLDMTYNIKNLTHNCYYGLICRNFNTKSRLVCNIDNWDASKTNYGGNQPAIKIQGCASRNKSINVGAMYFKYRIIDNLQGSDILNLNGDLYDVDESQNGTLFQYWNSGASTLNYKGNISIYSPGRAVTYTTVAGHKINISGDIILSNPSTAYTATLLYSDNGTTDFTGNIYGNNAGNIVMSRLGNVNINNSYIKSTVVGSRLVDNINLTTSTFRLNNSYVELKSDTTPLAKGTYINQFINNSTVINTGSGDTFSNFLNSGNLQILNSTVIASNSGAKSINYSGGSVNVISSNTTINTPYNVTNLLGNITLLTDLTY